MNYGIIKVMKNIEDNFYSAISVNCEIEFDTGGMFFTSPNTWQRERVSPEDKRIIELKINGIKYK